MCSVTPRMDTGAMSQQQGSCNKPLKDCVSYCHSFVGTASFSMDLTLPAPRSFQKSPQPAPQELQKKLQCPETSQGFFGDGI